MVVVKKKKYYENHAQTSHRRFKPMPVALNGHGCEGVKKDLVEGNSA
jgi:hypothetical protein